MAVASHGILLLPRLKLEHVKLTFFSRMRVDLASQVSMQYLTIVPVALCILINFVYLLYTHCTHAGFKSNAFAYFDDSTTKETQRFVSYFDRFFDCLNVRNLSDGRRRKNLT